MKKEPLYIFIHVMKCAGTTISRHIRESFNKEEVLFLFRDVEKMESKKTREGIQSYVLSLPAAIRKKTKVIIGHCAYYGIHELFPEKEAKYITFLREPLARTISHYNFGRTMLDKGIHTERHRKFLFRDNKRLSLKEWFFSNQVFHDYIFRFLFSHFFSDKNLSIIYDYSISEEEITRKNLEKIKEILARFYFVGITGKEEDMLFLYHRLGIKKFFGKENVSENCLGAEEIKQAKEYMLPCLTFDREIYNYVLEINAGFKKKHKKFYFIVLCVRLKRSSYFMLEWFYKISAVLKKRSKIYKKLVEIVKKRITVRQAN